MRQSGSTKLPARRSDRFAFPLSPSYLSKSFGASDPVRDSTRKMRFWLLFACLGVSLSGCSDPEFAGRPELAVVDASALPPPTRSDLSSAERPFVIGPGDQLAVDVYGLPDASRTVSVDAAGQIALPIAGSIAAAGHTPGEVAAVVEERLRTRHVRDPQVTVNLTQAVSQAVTVEGEVREPGLYPVAGRTTLLRTIARAKGLTEFARQNQVVVFRTVENRNMAALYDIRAIRLGMYQDPEIYANDVVVVGDSPSRRVFRDLLQSSGVLTAPIVAVLQSR